MFLSDDVCLTEDLDIFGKLSEEEWYATPAALQRLLR